MLSISGCCTILSNHQMILCFLHMLWSTFCEYKSSLNQSIHAIHTLYLLCTLPWLASSIQKKKESINSHNCEVLLSYRACIIMPTMQAMNIYHPLRPKGDNPKSEREEEMIQAKLTVTSWTHLGQYPINQTQHLQSIHGYWDVLPLVIDTQQRQSQSSESLTTSKFKLLCITIYKQFNPQLPDRFYV